MTGNFCKHLQKKTFFLEINKNPVKFRNLNRNKDHYSVNCFSSVVLSRNNVTVEDIANSVVVSLVDIRIIPNELDAITCWNRPEIE